MSHPQVTEKHRKVVIANWKMHGNLEQNKALIQGYLEGIQSIQGAQVVVCVPYPYLAQMQGLLSHTHVKWGAQNIAKYPVGAYTGEVSAEMLKDFGASHVIIGHSERSTAYCESDENIATKFMVAKRHGLVPVLCVGETLIEREAGVMEMVVSKQLQTIIQTHGAESFADTIISYEPIWAIGTGLAATANQAKAMLQFIRNKIVSLCPEVESRLKILYGGSVNAQNAVQLFSTDGIDGGLIGKSSLNAQEFVKICHAAETALAN